MADTFTVGGAKKPRWSVVREHPSAAVSALFILVLLVAGTVLPMPYDPRMPDPFATKPFSTGTQGSTCKRGC